MSPIFIGIIGIVVMVLVFMIGIPVAFAMVLVGFLGISYIVSTSAAFNYLTIDLWGTFSSYGLTVIPLFIFMGMICFNSGVSERAYYAGHKWLGHQRGGLAMATVFGCAGFAAVCGSLIATAATMGTVAIPEMKRYGYAPSLATGTVAAAGNLGVIIPPSVTFPIYAILVEQSVGKLLLAGIFPGILLAILMVIVIYVVCLLNPKLGPAVPAVSFKEKLASLTGLVDIIFLFGLVIGGLLVGWFTPSEAAAVGVGGALLIALARRRISWQNIKMAILSTVSTSCMVYMLVAGGTLFGHFLTTTTIPLIAAGWAAELGSPVAGLAIMMLVLFIGGMFMESLPLIIITVPVFFPVAMALGYDPIWFGVMVVVIGCTGTITPPVGILAYVVQGVAKDVPLSVVFKGANMFLPAFIICAVLLTAFPQIALFIPSIVNY